MGTVISNEGCDPDNWNNHGSIFEFQDCWYIAYHRACFANHTTRRACFEKISFNPNGTIPEVQMTVGGAEHPVCALNHQIEARRATRLHGEVQSIYNSKEHEVLKFSKPGDWAAYRGISFTGNEKKICLKLSEFSDDCAFEVRIARYEKGEADCLISAPHFTRSISAVNGVYTVYIRLVNGSGMLDWFGFNQVI